MNTTTKTILIAGGAVVGAFILMRFLAPTTSAPKQGQPSSTSSLGSLIGNIASIGGAVSSLFGSGKSDTTTYTTHYTDQGEFIVPAGASNYGTATGTGGYGIAGLDYAL